MHVKVRDRFRPFFPLALLRVRRERARARAEISSERAPFSFFSKDSEKKRERVRFAHFQFACIIKRIHRSPKEGSRERERVRVRFPPHKRESRASDLRSKKRNSQKRRETRACSRARWKNEKKLSFLSFASFLVIGEKREVESEKQKKKNEKSRGKRHQKGEKRSPFDEAQNLDQKRHKKYWRLQFKRTSSLHVGLLNERRRRREEECERTRFERKKKQKQKIKNNTDDGNNTNGGFDATLVPFGV